MARDDEFASTMRIDITPDVLRELKQAPPKLDTKKVRRKSPVIRAPETSKKESPASKYDQLLQSIYDGALVTDLDGNIVDCNARVIDFLQYTADELRSLNIQNVIAGADKKLLDTLRGNVQNERFALIQAYCIRKDESLFPSEIAVNILRFTELRMCFFIRDITVRRQREELLRTEHNAIQNAANGIAIADVDGVLEYVNPAVARMWGHGSAKELVGHDICSLWKDPGAARALIQNVLTKKETKSDELVAVRKDGSEFHVALAATCNIDTDDEVVGLVLSLVDDSDRRRAEDALRQAEQQRVMLASLGAACHHLGQPATVLLTNLEMMQRKEEVNGEVKELVDSSVEAAELIAELLHKLNTVAEYRTTEYIEDAKDPDAPTNRILQI